MDDRRWYEANFRDFYPTPSGSDWPTRFYGRPYKHLVPLSSSLKDLPQDYDMYGNSPYRLPDYPHLRSRKEVNLENDRHHSSGSDSAPTDADDTTNPKRTLKDICSRFAERTSCVGPPYINSSKNVSTKCFWSAVFVLMIIGTIVNVYLNINTFLQHPIKTTLSIGYSPLIFPTVTICNTNPVRLSALKMGSKDLQEFMKFQDPSDFKRDPSSQTNLVSTVNVLQTTESVNVGSPNVPPDQPNNSRQKRFVDWQQQQQQTGNKTFKPPKSDIGEKIGGQKDPRFQSLEEFRYLIGLENTSTRYDMSHHMSDMLISCSMEGRSCEAGNFSWFLTDDYGACFSFNQFRFGSKETDDLKKSYRQGNVYGLQLMLSLEVEEYIPGVAMGYGARVSISHPTNMPFPGTEGFFVSSGSETDIGVKMINISRLSEPYDVCQDPTAFVGKYGFEYTRQACQAVCVHSLILENCNCYDPSQVRLYPLNTTQNYNTCVSEEDLGCISNVEYKYSITESLSCTCPNPCKETTYDVRMSSRDWPEEMYQNILLDAICRRPNKQIACQKLIHDSPYERSRNFLKLNVFYRDLNYESLIEEPDYPESQFLSDLGGSIGLWIGLSVMSMVEVLELFASIFVWLGRSCLLRRRRKKEMDSSKKTTTTTTS